MESWIWTCKPFRYGCSVPALIIIGKLAKIASAYPPLAPA